MYLISDDLNSVSNIVTQAEKSGGAQNKYVCSSFNNLADSLGINLAIDLNINLQAFFINYFSQRRYFFQHWVNKVLPRKSNIHGHNCDHLNF